MTDLLVDLGHVGELELAHALAKIAGVELWDGQEAESEQLVESRRVIEVRRSYRRLYYATANPLDEDLSNRMRFLSAAQEVIPLVATRTMIADAHAQREIGQGFSERFLEGPELP